jgi:hypothetical protein
MSDKTFDIEVQPDLLEKLTRASPVQALAEFIWNGLDADAKRVSVEIHYDEIGGTSHIVIQDNGTGMAFSEAPELFRRLGGSWKKAGAKTTAGRYLHGQEGRGRFKAFSLGRVVDWDVTYARDGALSSYRISMLEDNLRQVRISDEKPADKEKTRGVTVTIGELHKDFRSLDSAERSQELNEIFALYLKDYRDVEIVFAGEKVNPEALIESITTLALSNITEESIAYPAQLEIIGWRSLSQRALYLCDERGFPLCQIDTRFHVGPFHFSAYLRSSFMTKLLQEGTIEIAEMNASLKPVVEEAIEKIKEHSRT